MSDSKLVSYIKLSPNRTHPRRNNIDRITIHCVVGQLSAEAIGSIFASAARQASSNYGVGFDGKIGMYVQENDRSWCSSSGANDHRAITIEVASDTTHPYAVTDKAYASLLNLVEDICKRNGKNKLIWFGNKDKTLAYTPKSNEMVLTVHRWFANKACPGDYLYNKHPEIVSIVNKRLSKTETTFKPYLVRILVGALNIRKKPTTLSDKTGMITDRGVYTIVEEATGYGASKWGKLKSGAGWIALDYTRKV